MGGREHRRVCGPCGAGRGKAADGRNSAHRPPGDRHQRSGQAAHAGESGHFRHHAGGGRVLQAGRGRGAVQPLRRGDAVRAGHGGQGPPGHRRRGTAALSGRDAEKRTGAHHPSGAVSGRRDHVSGSAHPPQSGTDREPAQRRTEGLPSMAAGSDPHGHGRAAAAHVGGKPHGEPSPHPDPSGRSGSTEGQLHRGGGTGRKVGDCGGYGAPAGQDQLQQPDRQGLSGPEPLAERHCPGEGTAGKRGRCAPERAGPHHGPAGQPVRAAGKSHQPRRAPDAAGGRLYSSRLQRPAGRIPGRLHPRQTVGAGYGSRRAGSDRHQEPTYSVQPGVRVLYRSDQEQSGSGAPALCPPPDAGQRRALHHAGAAGDRKENSERRAAGSGAGDAAFYRCAAGDHQGDRSHPAERAGAEDRRRAAFAGAGGPGLRLRQAHHQRDRRNPHRGGTASHCGADGAGYALRAQRRRAGHRGQSDAHHHRPQHGR